MAYGTRYPSTGFSLSGAFPPGVKWLLIVNTGIFLLQFFSGLFGSSWIFGPFALRPAEAVGGFAVWQFFTYMFLHGGIGHILWNMLPLWMFGAELERTWGTREFLKYYFLCGMGAALCVVVANYAMGNPYVTTLGASGAIYGVLLAFGLLFPRTRILFFFLFPIEARFFVAIVGAIAFMSALGSGGGGTVSHVAHLGGMVFGYLYLKSGLLKRRKLGYAGYGGAAAGPRPIYRPSLKARVQGWYKQYRMQRARRKFEVYLRKRQERDHDRTVH